MTLLKRTEKNVLVAFGVRVGKKKKTFVLAMVDQIPVKQCKTQGKYISFMQWLKTFI